MAAHFGGVIKNLADRDSEKLWLTGRAQHMPSDIWQRSLMKPQLIDAADELAFMQLPPGNHLEALKGDRHGQLSNRINDHGAFASAGQSLMPSKLKLPIITKPQG